MPSEEEVPLIEAAYKLKMAEDEQYHTTMQQQNAEKHRQTWETNVEEKKRLAKMAADKEEFAAAIVSRRSEEFEALRLEREERINELRAFAALSARLLAAGLTFVAFNRLKTKLVLPPSRRSVSASRRRHVPVALRNRKKRKSAEMRRTGPAGAGMNLVATALAKRPPSRAGAVTTDTTAP